MNSALALIIVLASLEIAEESAATPAPRQGIAVIVHRTIREHRPALAVRIINTSSAQLCIPVEIIRNPRSYAINIEVRNRTGHPVIMQDPGFLLPPIPGMIRLNPGDSREASYFMDSRVRHGTTILGQYQARVGFRYDNCDGSLANSFRSRWILVRR